MVVLSTFEPVEFSGWEVVKYYYYCVQNGFAGYSWQIITAYHITLYSALTLVALFILFWIKVWKLNREKATTRRLSEYYQNRFTRILGAAEIMDEMQIYEVLEKTPEEVHANHPLFYARMLEKARMDMYEIVFLPNMRALALALGVTDYFERQLLQRKNVFSSLQMLLLLQITVSEGRLANYVNHTNHEIRMMARLLYITCSSDEPYRFLSEDLSREQSLFRPMLLNYIFGWMKSQDRPMPHFLVLSERVKNDYSAAFLIREVAYWGSDHEKKQLKNYFLAERHEVRMAAIEITSSLNDLSAEDALKASYYEQPEVIRREVLRTMLAMKSGKQLDFFVEAYHASTSRETQEMALYCIYNYGNEGRRYFEMMRHSADEATRRLIDQVDSIDLINQLQML